MAAKKAEGSFVGNKILIFLQNGGQQTKIINHYQEQAIIANRGGVG